LRKLADINVVKEYVRERADLLQIIKEDVGDKVWKEEGSNTFVTTSPFREENKPSFKVSDTRFKDWGGEQHGGDVFSWVQLWHGLRFEESILHVAERCKIDITSHLRNPTPEELQLSHYKAVNRIAAEWMHQCFRENTMIRDDYLSRSGFTLSMVEPYLVGYCPSIEGLITHVSSQIKLTDDDVNRLEFNRKDLYTNAIVYPVHDHSGDVAFFYTRQLIDDAPYKGNKKEHPLQDTSIIYGFHVAKRKLRSNGAVLVLVEGQRDTIALQCGGVLGSDLREEQLNALKDYKVRQLTFCYDNDNTGWTKSLDLINKPKNFGDMLVLVTCPEEIDSDPHDAWRTGGDGAIYKMLQNAVIPLEYYVEHSGFNLDTITDQHRLLTSLRDYLTQVTGVHLSIAISYLSTVLNSAKEAITDYIAEIKAAYSQLYNLEAEKILISYCMKNSASYSVAKSAGISELAFTYSKYKKLFLACQIAFEKYAENYTAQVVLDEAMAKYIDQDLPAIAASVLEENNKYTEVVACEIVLDMWKRRTASEQASELVSASRDLSRSFTEVVNDHRKNLISAVSSSRPQARTPPELAKELYNEVKEREKSGGNLIIGHDFYAMPSINMILGGIQSGHMLVIAGDTGAGKSLLAMNVANCIAVTHGKRYLWIGQEMQSKENTMRLASITAGINNTKLQAGNLSQNEANTFVKAVQTIENSGLYMAQPKSGDIDEILAIIDEYRWKYDIEGVIWDYIGLINASQDQFRWSREQIIGHASTTIKNRVTIDMGLPVILIAQMNRDKHAEGKHKIAGSFRIIQDADDFLWIEEKSAKQIAEDGVSKGNRLVRIGKRRGGVSNFAAHAYLDTDPRSCTLQIRECTTPSEQSKLFSELAA